MLGVRGPAACSAWGTARKYFCRAGSCPSGCQLPPKEAREHLKVKRFRRKRREKRERCGSVPPAAAFPDPKTWPPGAESPVGSQELGQAA